MMFQSTHSLRSATSFGIFWHCSMWFQSTHSLRSATDKVKSSTGGTTRFNPRTPCGVRLTTCILSAYHSMFQSTHSLRSATTTRNNKPNNRKVSIHALLAECDQWGVHARMTWRSFNPRTPCGVRHSFGIFWHCSTWFQSTHSLRSATETINQTTTTERFQSTHSLRSATLCGGQACAVSDGFNPRTPCGVRLRPTLYIATQQSKSYFAPTSLKRPSLHGCSF